MDVQQQDRVVARENHVHTTQPQATSKPEVTGERDVYEANLLILESFCMFSFYALFTLEK